MLNKPLLKSLTVWGLVIVGAVEGAEKAGLVPAGTGQSVAALVQTFGGLLAAFGLRRAVGGAS